MICIKKRILEGVISPNPTEERMVAPQYHPTTYLSRLLSALKELSLSQVLVSPKDISTSARTLSRRDRKCSKIKILKSSLTIAIIVYALLDRDIAFYTCEPPYFIRLNTRNTTISLTITGTPIEERF